MKKFICGNDIDRMPDWAFKLMAIIFNVSDRLKSPDKKLIPFNIRKGQTVIDYGCGTGRYLKPASELVGETGTVYAVDIHELAIESAFRMIKRYNLKNVNPILTDGKSVNIPSQTADMVYAIDMFHMVKDSKMFLEELYRITKPEGVVYLEDGHQQRIAAKQKVIDSGCWEIYEETKTFMKLRPIPDIP
jgi:ubiquinone/menaquinone biosynthesis C-methylase UbiE